MTADHAVRTIGAVIEKGYNLRLAARLLGWERFERLEMSRCCTLDGHSIRFDEGDYVERLLSKNTRLAEREAFEKRVGSIKPGPPEPRLRQDGHDLTEVMAWYLNELGYHRSTSEGIVGLILAAANWQRLRYEPLFQMLVARF